MVRAKVLALISQLELGLGLGLELGLGLGLAAILSSTCVHAAEYVLLGRGVAASERARQLNAGSFVVAGKPSPPPATWMRPDFDDGAWTGLPVSSTGGRILSAPGSPWLTAGASSSLVLGSLLPDGGLIFAEEALPDGGTPAAVVPPRDGGTVGDAGVPADGGTRDGGVAPMIPPCAGTLYLRRRFGLSAADPARLLASLSTLTLRIRYADGFAAYLNGVEVARRRLPEAALTEPSTLGSERGPVEPESHHFQLPHGLLQAQDNLLAVEVHPRAIERCPRLELELVGSDGPRVVRGPYIERLLDGELDLAVETDTPTHLEVIYGRGDTRHARDRRLADDLAAAPQTVHHVHVSGLRPGNTYHYQVSLLAPAPGSPRVELPLVPVHTPPAAGRPLRFVVYGDSRSGHAIHAQVIAAILDEDPDLVLNIGDIVERGTEDSDWDRFFAVAGPLISRLPFFLAPGNHEYARRGQGAQKMFQLWGRQMPPQAPLPAAPPLQMLAAARPTSAPPADTPPRGYRSFDIAGVHFLALDSNQVRLAEQLRFVEADLKNAQARHPRAIVVFMHDGPYSMGWHGDNSTIIRDYVPLFERYHVSVVFSGHDHDYERGRRGRLDYIVTGGGGAELRPLRCGVPGKRRCKHPPLAFFNEHNYVSVEVLPGALRLCAKRPDASPLEPCQLLLRH